MNSPGSSADWSDGYVVDVPYTHSFFHHMSPVHLWFTTVALGILPPDIQQPYNYLELGCGNGLSTNVFAAANPNGTFYANDINPTHIWNARAVAKRSGLTNVNFLEASFDQLLDVSLPDFDFITLHGIYSWVGESNRQRIVEIIRRKLKPGGLVYISYNTLPGWAHIEPLRALAYEIASRSSGSSIKRMDSALAFLEKLKGANAAYFSSSTAVQKHLEEMKGADRNYAVHEYLNRDFTPLYHADVVRQLGAAKLTFIGSAHTMDNLEHLNLPPQVLEIARTTQDPGPNPASDSPRFRHQSALPQGPVLPR